jgi:hypothetical protein
LIVQRRWLQVGVTIRHTRPAVVLPGCQSRPIWPIGSGHSTGSLTTRTSKAILPAPVVSTISSSITRVELTIRRICPSRFRVRWVVGLPSRLCAPPVVARRSCSTVAFMGLASFWVRRAVRVRNPLRWRPGRVRRAAGSPTGGVSTSAFQIGGTSSATSRVPAGWSGGVMGSNGSGWRSSAPDVVTR